MFLFFSCLSITKKALPTSGLKDYAVGKEGFYGGSVFKMDYVIIAQSLLVSPCCLGIG